MDIRVENHGSIVLLRPMSDAGRAWLAENTPQGPETQYLGDALACEPRYVEHILLGMRDDDIDYAIVLF